MSNGGPSDTDVMNVSSREAFDEDRCPVPNGGILFGVTFRCNYSCRQCNLQTRDREFDELALDEIREVFLQSKLLRESSITVTGGEPFIRTDTPKVVSELCRMGYLVTVFTNGSFPERIEQMLDSHEFGKRLTLIISIDGLYEVHDSVRGAKNAFEKALHSLSIGQRFGINIAVSTVILRENLDILDDMRSYFSKIGVKQYFSPEMRFTDFAYSTNEIPHLIPFLEDHDLAFVLSKGAHKIHDCHAGYNGCFINPEGVVYTCLTKGGYSLSEEFVMGSLREFRLLFDNLWSSPQARTARMNVKQCSGCALSCEFSREDKWHKRFETEVSTATPLDGFIDPRKLDLEVPRHLDFRRGDCKAFLSSGWYFAEDGFRWMEKKASVYLKIHPNNRTIHLNALCNHPNISQRAVTMSISLDDTEIAQLRFLSNKLTHFRAQLPKIETYDVHRITLEVDRTWVPREASGTADTRRLGAAVYKIWVD